MRVRKGLIILSALFILLGIFKVDVKAETNESPTVKVRVEYVKEDNGRKVVAEGNGVLIGTEKGCNAVVTPMDLVTLSKKEKKKNKIPAKAKIEIIVRLESQSVEQAASIVATNKELKFAVLKLGGNLFTEQHALFDLDMDAYTAEQAVYAMDVNGMKREGILAGTKGSGSKMFLIHNIKTDKGIVGTGLYNTNNEFLGLCIKAENKENRAIPANSIATTLTTLGIAYDVADHVDHSANTTELTTALKVVEEQDLSIYTEKSKQILTEAIAHAKEVVGKENPTQEEVDEAYNMVTSAQEGLTKIKISITTIIMLVALGVFAVTVVGLILFIVLDKKKRKKQQLEAKETEKKRAPKYHDAYKPDMTKSYVGNNNFYVKPVSGNLENTGNTGNMASAMEGFAPSSKEISTQGGETSVLDTSNEMLVLYSESLKCSFNVNMFPYVIGKNSLEANLVFNNPAVSRKHIAIYNDYNKYRVVDLGSKNGTFINGMRINPGTAYDISDGDVITVANEKIQVGIG